MRRERCVPYSDDWPRSDTPVSRRSESKVSRLSAHPVEGQAEGMLSISNYRTLDMKPNESLRVDNSWKCDEVCGVVCVRGAYLAPF